MLCDKCDSTVASTTEQVNLWRAVRVERTNGPSIFVTFFRNKNFTKIRIIANKVQSACVDASIIWWTEDRRKREEGTYTSKGSSELSSIIHVTSAGYESQMCVTVIFVP